MLLEAYKLPCEMLIKQGYPKCYYIVVRNVLTCEKLVKNSQQIEIQ